MMDDRKRLFVAVDFPQTVKDQLGEVCHGVRDVRWVSPAQMHLTLRFIGDVDVARFEQVKSALQSVRFEVHTITLKGVGHFPAQGMPRVLWAGVESTGVLKRLARDIERVLVGLGFEADRKGFSPHVTLARLKNPLPAGELKQFYARNKHFESDAVIVDAFVLFSSALSSGGAVYTAESVYPARKPSSGGVLPILTEP